MRTTQAALLRILNLQRGEIPHAHLFSAFSRGREWLLLLTPIHTCDGLQDAYSRLENTLHQCSSIEIDLAEGMRLAHSHTQVSDPYLSRIIRHIDGSGREFARVLRTAELLATAVGVTSENAFDELHLWNRRNP